uniref:Uncharacterized protein n=1 Tax=Naja naja TaxID=35670 RepID=A0A8C6Y6L7_NAJNA
SCVGQKKKTWKKEARLLQRLWGAPHNESSFLIPSVSVVKKGHLTCLWDSLTFITCSYLRRQPLQNHYTDY